MRFAEAENLARSVRNDRPGKGAGTPERNQPMSDEVLPYPRRLAAWRWHGPIREMHRRSEASEGTRLRQAIARRGRKAVHVRESRITLIWELRQCIKQEAECDGRATWSNDEQNLI